MPESGGRQSVGSAFQRRISRRELLAWGGEGLGALAWTVGCQPVPLPVGTPVARPVTPEGVSLEVKIGQMLMVGFRGLDLSGGNPIVDDIRQRHLGGVAIFDYDVALKSPVRNVQSPQQVKALTAALQKLASVPLLISVDQEGGKVVRLKEKFGFPPLVSEQFLGTRNDLALTRQYAQATAKALAEVGINLNLAPVVDLNINPDNPVIGGIERSFSADPAIVTSHALAVIQAHHAQHVGCTLKHFPGHGSSQDDSHVGFVDVTATWSEAELEPYAAIIKAGQTDAVMTAHIFHAKLDPQWPATLSKKIITGILRQRLQFDGVIISDDMQMGAIALSYGFETALQMAIEAGVDILAIANNITYDPQIMIRAVAVIKQLVKDGKISPQRIDQSYWRIRRLKQSLA
jgi:beta-N-acetylhexosaminidase